MASRAMEVGAKPVSLTSTSYWTTGKGNSDAYMLENIVFINFSFSSADTGIPTGGYHKLGTVSKAPKTGVTFVYSDGDARRYAIAIRTNGDIEIYNYQNSTIHISGGCLIAYRTS